MKRMKYIGIDISKRKCDVCIIDAKGNVLERDIYPNTPEGAKKYVAQLKRKHRGKLVAACETTANMWHITYDVFEAAGIDIKLADTYKMVLISRTSKKTDKVDAEKIAQVLRMGMIPECHVPDKYGRSVRQLTRRRESLGQDRTRAANRLHALLDMHGKTIDASRLHLKKAIAQMNGMILGDEDSVDTTVLRSHVAQIESLNAAIKTIEERIDVEAVANEDALLLMSMTGFDSYSAIAMSAEIDDISRFHNVKQLVSWAGMCPVVRQSGDEIHHGGIKKTGRNRIANWLLIEAANTAIRYDTRMKATYEAAKARHGGKHALAIVVVANKMATIAYYVLKSRKPYTHHNEQRYERKLKRLRSRAKKNSET